MLIRRPLAALALSALTLGATPFVAGATASPGMSVPRTTIEAGDTLPVSITAECTEGEWGYGSINQYIDGWYDLDGKVGEIAQRSYKRGEFAPHVSNVFSFPVPGTYTLRNYCGEEVGSIVIKVIAPTPTTTTTTTTTSTTTTTAPTTTSTTTAPSTTAVAPTTTTPAAPTTTAPAAVAGTSVARTSLSGTEAASGAPATARSASYAG